MKIAIEEHLKCTVYPKVGAVVAKGGKILSTGYRGEIGRLHAERIALGKLKPAQRVDSTIYTTLEPCINLHEDQETSSCSDLIIESGVGKVVIGVLDPNATIYSQGYRKLLENNVSVGFFSRRLREAVEEETFEYGDVHRVVGSGKRRVPVIGSGISIDVQFSISDLRSIPITWNALQYQHGFVDLLSENGAVRIASGASKFGDITDPDIFRFPSHFARMQKDSIAVVRPSRATFFVLIKLIGPA
jgi:diaminohydroxyphosphoribosylaminopyrimidine deaminase/5-amino-6-(5-phosphoribosylamino)uracil reductase